jgi:hypothetical protein
MELQTGITPISIQDVERTLSEPAGIALEYHLPDDPENAPLILAILSAASSTLSASLLYLFIEWPGWSFPPSQPTFLWKLLADLLHPVPVLIWFLLTPILVMFGLICGIVMARKRSYMLIGRLTLTLNLLSLAGLVVAIGKIIQIVHDLE